SALLISQGTEGSGRAWQSEGQIVRRWGQGSASRGGAAQREPGRGEQGNQGKPAEAGAKARARRAHQRPTLRYDLEVPHHVRRSLRLPLCASLAPRAPQASRVSSGLRRSRSPPRLPPPSPPPPRPTPSSTEPPPAPRRGRSRSPRSTAPRASRAPASWWPRTGSPPPHIAVPPIR